MKKATAMAAAVMMSLSLAAVPAVNVGAATTTTRAAAAAVKTVTNLKGSVQEDNSVKLSWDSNGASIYFVLRKDNSTGSYRAIDMAFGNTYTDKKTQDNMTYSYVITCFTSGQLSDPSNEITLDIGKGEVPIVKPAAPEHLIAIPMGEKGVQIFWQQLDDESIISYGVLRADSENGSYKALTLASADENSFVDTTAKAGKTYYYKIQAFNGVLGDESAAASALAGSTIMDSDLIAAIDLEADVPMAQNVTAKALDSKSAEVNWESAGDGLCYGVFRSENLYDSDYVCVEITEDTQFTDNTMLNSGSDYYYKIQTIRDGELSEYTDPVKITTEASDVAAPKNLTLVQDGSAVVLNWANFDGKDQIVGILRSETEDHGYKAVDISWSGATYTDKTVKAGKTYYYKIQTLTGANLSVYSDIASITIK